MQTVRGQYGIQKSSILAWQGWRLELPPRWNPIRVEGDFNQGQVLLADLHRPRLGLRWHKPRQKNIDALAWSQRAMRAEVGQLAADEAQPYAMPTNDWAGSLLYIEPDPPGRDVWIGYSGVSGRVVEVIHHARRRERILAEQILPALQDMPVENERRWSIFELSCIVPAAYSLERHLLNAGDLSLLFSCPRKSITLRQVTLASLALQRLPLEKWLAQQQSIERRHYRSLGEPEAIEVMMRDGRQLSGLSQLLKLRRRFSWMLWRERELASCALHDSQRDRLLFALGSQPEAMEAIKTVGWAQHAVS